MTDDADPVLEAVEALRAKGIVATPWGDDFEGWKIGSFVYTDHGIVRLAAVLAPDEFAGERS